jgi:tetratricopeptide (TPR) repeat protein
VNSETTDDERDFSAPFLQIAAALRRFDKDLLNHVAGDALAFGWLEAQGMLRICDEHASLVCLLEPAQRAAHTRIQRDAPLDEIRHLSAALAYLHPPGATDVPAQRAEHERRYFFYFDLLLALLVQRYDWERVRHELLRAHGAASLIARAQHLVAMYQGYVEVHNQQSTPGRARLEVLLATPSLDPDVQARTLLGIAQSHWYETRFDLAIQIYEQLLSLARATGQPRYEGLALVNMVGAYTELEQYDRALDLASQSLEIFRALDEPARRACPLSNRPLRLPPWALG